MCVFIAEMQSELTMVLMFWARIEAAASFVEPRASSRSLDHDKYI
jgi:hypothetical protein